MTNPECQNCHFLHFLLKTVISALSAQNSTFDQNTVKQALNLLGM